MFFPCCVLRVLVHTMKKDIVDIDLLHWSSNDCGQFLSFQEEKKKSMMAFLYYNNVKQKM